MSISLNYQQVAINELSLTYISDYTCSCIWNLHELNVVSLKTAYFKYMVKKIKALLSKVNHTSRYSKIFTGIVWL